MTELTGGVRSFVRQWDFGVPSRPSSRSRLDMQKRWWTDGVVVNSVERQTQVWHTSITRRLYCKTWIAIKLLLHMHIPHNNHAPFPHFHPLSFVLHCHPHPPRGGSVDVATLRFNWDDVAADTAMTRIITWIIISSWLLIPIWGKRRKGHEGSPQQLTTNRNWGTTRRWIGITLGLTKNNV